MPALFLLLLIGFRYAEPVGDGDLFWQMSYGKQLLERGTLIPDHTLYSWTDAHNDTMYCAWLAEIFFYLTYQAGGLPLIFAFRYLVIFGAIGLAYSYARLTGLQNRAELWLGLVTFSLATYVGTIIKPELFSYGFMSLLAWSMYRFKLADWRGEGTTRYLVALPVIACLWANSHGVYVFGMVAMAIFTMGEILNYLVSRRLALKWDNLKKLVMASLLSVVTMCITPYGISYPLSAVKELLGVSTGTQSSGDKSAYESIAAHMTIFQTPAFHFQHYLYLMAFVVFVLFILRFSRGFKARVDCGYMFINLIFGFVYLWYLRTTFYWPPFFLYSSMWTIYQLAQPVRAGVPDEEADDDAGLDIPILGDLLALLTSAARGLEHLMRDNRGVIAIACHILALFFCFRGIYEAYFMPYASSWCGFGITYWNPVVESEFIEKYHPNADKIYNDYDSGGWLIWRLYPKMKVLIDPRSFPYRHFYTDYINYERGSFPLDEFHKKWPDKPEVAIASLKNTMLWRAFLRSPEWVGAYVGPSSVVFCRRGYKYPPEAVNFAPNRFEEIQNSQKALQIFQFGIEAQYYDVSWLILDIMKRKFFSPEDRKLIESLSAYKECVLALQAQEIDKALEAQEKCRHLGLFYNNAILIQLYQVKAQALTKQGKRPNDPEMTELYRKASMAQQGLDPLGTGSQ